MTRPDGPHSLAPGGRIDREKRTIAAMVAIYCRGRHGSRRGAPCEECRELLDYAVCRLDRCPFGARKSTCVDCPIHCYRPAMRARVKEVMKYAGPRMVVRHPVLAFWHLLDGRRSRLRESLAGSGTETSG